MILAIVNKVLVILFTLACLNSIRHAYYFVQSYVKTADETYQKYKVSEKSLVFLGISLAYIISSIFIGITI